MTEEEKLYFSGILIGNVITEKTSLREELGKPGPADITMTGPFELIIHEMEIEKQTIRFLLWTIDSRSESWEKIRESYYKDASGAIIVFDSAKEDWIENLKFWVKEIKKANTKITMVLVYNLIDKEENDSIQIREIIAGKIFKRYKKKFSIVELNSISNKEIKEIYLTLCKKYVKKKEKTK
ncbi:MAG: hypothetical protein ACTSR1_04210 [Candidatus Heimdallarchaeota archaeon]